uniref:Uncharacterized protein n=1 Tax=Pseudo-nitzschia australis TaxID=44445 RepID=A0A7S4ATL8_9STRA
MKCLPCRHITGTTLSLCLAAATHSFLLFSFFPYAGYMAMTLLDNNGGSVTVNNVGIYTGMLGATFTFGRFLGFLPWKFARNRLGGKCALMLSLLLTGLASVGVGLATTFSGALVARFAQGISNCISGCVKRAAINAQYNVMSERAVTTRSSTNGGGHRESVFSAATIAEGNPQALVLSVMWWGAAFGPIVGGLLSDPRFLRVLFKVDSESELDWYDSRPYLLSNVCSAVLCWLSMACTAIFVDNSPPNLAAEREEQSPVSASTEEQRPLLTTAGSGSSVNATTPNMLTTFLKLWKINSAARYHLAAYWSLSFVVACCDEALPLFLITSKESTGLGLSEGQVGAVLSTAGLIVAIGHHAALERLLDVENGSKNGMYRILSVSAILGTVPVVLMPLSLWLNGIYDTSNGNGDARTEESLLGLTTQSFLFLVVLVAFVRGSVSLYLSYIGIVTGQTLRVVQKDEAARIMTIGALLARCLASVVAGAVLSHFMSSVSYSIHFGGSTTLSFQPSWMVWIVIGLVFGTAAATMTVILVRHSGDGILSRKQRQYFMARLKRMGSVRSDWEAYHESLKTISFRWIKSTFGRPKERKTPIAPTATRSEEKDGDEMVESSSSSSSSNHQRGITWIDHIVAPGVDFDKVNFFILGTHKRDKACAPHVLTPPLMNALQKYLPRCNAQSNFWLKYSLLRDGVTMHALEAKAGLSRFNIVAIETLKGDVFGCFMTRVRHPNG